MCGIFCAFSKENNDVILDLYKSCEFYIRRRGPNFDKVINFDFANYKFIFSASVLWLQGEKLNEQPVENDQSVFLFNGDIFDGCLADSERVIKGDTNLLLNEFESKGDVINILSNVDGPYSLIYLNKNDQKIYFGRDIYGRRSLLIGYKENVLILTSTASKDLLFDCIELPAIGIYCFDLNDQTFHLYPWSYRNKNFYDKVNELQSILQVDLIIEDNKITESKIYRSPELIDLRIFQIIKDLDNDDLFQRLLSDPLWEKNIQSLCVVLEKSVEKRILNLPAYCQKCIKEKLNCNHSLIGVLFSGGLDCTILTLLLSKFYDANRPIDLINVAFEKGKTYNTPDRETGMESYRELKRIHPERRWNFISVNVSEKELISERQNHIKHLIHPLNTILDDSLGCALWFAARGKSEEYVSPCRVLFVGMGADELFGGYTRHRAALKRNGWKGLHDVLNEDWQNISFRNLARDDRVVSDHGRQLRTPYLDEKVVEFARSLNCWEKTFPVDLPQGIGEKILLRAVAYKYGLRKSAIFKKRALQFGCRIANSKENAHDVSPRLQ